MTGEARTVGVIPAAGHASRLGDGIETSKEVLELGGQPAAAHLLRRMAIAKVSRAVVTLRAGKWDIPQALLNLELGVELSYVIVKQSPSQLHSVAAALPSVGDNRVALGYPDVLFRPHDAYAALLERQSTTGADIVLGLFPSDRPEKVDMVVLDQNHRPIQIVIKQPSRGLQYSWSIAVWTPRFSKYLAGSLPLFEGGYADPTQEREASVGDIVQTALDDGMAAEAVVFEDGYYLDIGTLDDLARARQLKHL